MKTINQIIKTSAALKANGEPELVQDSPRLGTLPPRFLLVAEDDLRSREYYSEILTAAGYSFDLVSNGEAAWESVKGRFYSLIITDHDMPRMTGLAFINRLDTEDYMVPVILVSGSIEANDPLASGRCLIGMISKPFSDKLLFDKIEEALSLNLPIWFTYPMQLVVKGTEAFTG